MSNRRKLKPMRKFGQPPLPAFPDTGNAVPDDDFLAQMDSYYTTVAEVIKRHNACHPGWTEYVRMVQDMAGGYRWSTAPWKAWRVAEGNEEAQEILSLMLFGTPFGSRTCIAEIASMTQQSVLVAVEAFEHMEAQGLIQWDNDAQKTIAYLADGSRA